MRALAPPAIVGLAIGAACSAPYPPVAYRTTETPPALERLAPAVVVGPVAHPAASWNEPPPDAAASHESDAVFSALYELARDKGDPERDPRLDLAAAELADAAGRGAPLDDALVGFTLHEHGVVDIAALAVAAKSTEPAAIVDELTPQLGDVLFAGNVHVGVGGMAPMVIVVTHTALVALAPGTPRFVDAHGETSVVATLDSRFHAPHVTITHDDGSIEHPQLAAQDRWTFRFPVRCGARNGTRWVLVEACDDKNTDMRLLLFPIDCGTHSPDAYRAEPRANAEAPDLERRLASLVNRERTAAGLAPLAGDRRAEAAARVEAQLMARTTRIAHELGGTTTATRLRDAGLVPPVVHEATLHAPDLATASELLMNEPAYRAVVMAPDVTHVGVAVARDDHGELFIAIELVQIVPPIDVARLRTEILARLRTRLPFKGVLREDKLLDELTLEYARGRAAGWTEPDMMAYMERDDELIYGPYDHMRRAMTLLLHDAIGEVDLGPQGTFDGVGLAVVQAPRNGAMAGRVWVVILLGKSRPVPR